MLTHYIFIQYLFGQNPENQNILIQGQSENQDTQSSMQKKKKKKASEMPIPHSLGK